MSEHNQQFDSFTQWVNKASSWLTRHELYSERPANPFRAICFDTKGRHCRIGKDFNLARDEKAFPIKWLWPDQIAGMKAENERLKALNAELVKSLRSVIETIDARSDDDRKRAVSLAIAIGMTSLSKAESEAQS